MRVIRGYYTKNCSNRKPESAPELWNQSMPMPDFVASEIALLRALRSWGLSILMKHVDEENWSIHKRRPAMKDSRCKEEFSACFKRVGKLTVITQDLVSALCPRRALDCRFLFL